VVLVVAVDLRREASAATAAAAAVDTVAVAAAAVDLIVTVVAEAAAVAVDTIVINPAQPQNCKVWQSCRTFFVLYFSNIFCSINLLSCIITASFLAY
jgi:hypothetical protein